MLHRAAGLLLALAAALMYQGVVLFEKLLLRRRDGRCEMYYICG